MPSHEEREADNDDDLLCGGGVGGVGEETVALGRTRRTHSAIFHVSVPSTACLRITKQCRLNSSTMINVLDSENFLLFTD